MGLQWRHRGVVWLLPHDAPVLSPPPRGWARKLTFCEGLPLVQLAHELLGVKGGTLQGPRVWLLRGAGLRWGDTEESKLGRKMGVWVRAGLGEQG